MRHHETSNPYICYKTICSMKLVCNVGSGCICMHLSEIFVVQIYFGLGVT